MSEKLSPSECTNWRRLVELGRRLMAQSSLADQRAIILESVAQLVEGRATLWLSESLHPLVDEDTPSPAPDEPTDLMRRARQSRQTAHGAMAVAVPLLTDEAVLGALQVERSTAPLAPGEIELLEGIASQAAVAFQAAQQVAIERWRVEQLALVRNVSAQVAAVLDLDELARRVTDLILRTFDYYHVALFTLETGDDVLLRRAAADRSLRPSDARKIPAAVKLGEGLVGHAAQSGEEILADDVGQDSRYLYLDSLPETRSEVALPLKIEGSERRVLGVLDVQSEQPRRFDETDMLVLRALADQIAIAVEGARLYSNLRRRADQLSTVAEVGHAVTSILDLDLLLDKVVTLIHEQFGYPAVHLFTVEPAPRQIAYRAGRGPLAPLLQEANWTCDLDETAGLISQAACRGEAALIDDVEDVSDDVIGKLRDSSPAPPAEALAFETRAQLAVPLTFGGEVLGVIEARNDRPHAFGEEDLFLLKALADSVAISIRNANLYRSERWRRQAAESLQDVAGLLSAGVEVEQVLDAILTELERNLPCDAAAVWLLDGGVLCLSAVHGAAAEFCIGDFSTDVAPWLYRALSADQPLIRTPSSPPEPLGAMLGFPTDYSAIAAPLRVGERQLGLLTLIHRTRERYGTESRAMTAAFASYAAVAIENARLYQNSQEQAYVSAALLQVARTVAGSSDLDETLEAVVRIMPMLVGIDRCIIYLKDEKETLFRPAQVYGVAREIAPQLMARSYESGDFPLLDAVRERDELVNVKSRADWEELIPPSFIAHFSPHERGGALLAVPLSVKGDVMGAMVTGADRDTGDGFDERQMEIITGVAQQTAMAVQNARLQREMTERERLERELQLAREIQQTFIPEHLPHLPGWELDAVWRAARQVAGDFYDVFDLPDGKLGMVVADVADKGMPAALFMALTRTLMRAAALEERSPADALARVNTLLAPDARHGMFVTAVYAVLAPETGELTYANAGHHPPLLLRSGERELESLGKGGIALGVLEEVSFEEQAFSMRPGDHLILYTDGVTEAFSADGGMYGAERLLASVRASDNRAAHSMLEGIMASLSDFVGDTPASDDLTLMVVHRSAYPARSRSARRRI